MKAESREALPRRLFVVSLAMVLLGGAFLLGAHAESSELPPIPQLRSAYDTLTNIGSNDVMNHPRRHHLQPSRGGGQGVTVNEAGGDGALMLMAGFFDEENQVRLVERDGTAVRTWSLDYFEHFPDTRARPCNPSSPLQIDTHGAQLTPRGELVVNYEYCGTVKLDRCGALVWSLAEPTHHSVVPAEAGGWWLLGRHEWHAGEEPDRFPPFSAADADHTVLEDTILRISDDGEILDEISIPELMRDNGLEALLTATWDTFESEPVDRWELVHANKVTELAAELAGAYPMFEAGDLAVSLRGRNLVMVVDPESEQVRWHQVGPWLRQHDPEFRPDGRLSVFNNNVYYRAAYVDEQTVLTTPFTTNITAVDPATGRTEVVFGEAPGQEMLSVIRGEHELLDGGGMLITEFDAGRVLEVDDNGRIVWEFVNAYDEDYVGEITNASLYAADWFETDWRPCE